MLEKEVKPCTCSDNLSKLSFSNLVKNFESKIIKSKLPNSSSSSTLKSKLILSTPTKRERVRQVQNENDVICSSQISKTCSELIHRGGGGRESPAKRGGMRKIAEVAYNQYADSGRE